MHSIIKGNTGGRGFVYQERLLFWPNLRENSIKTLGFTQVDFFSNKPYVKYIYIYIFMCVYERCSLWWQWKNLKKLAHTLSLYAELTYQDLQYEYWTEISACLRCSTLLLMAKSSLKNNCFRSASLWSIEMMLSVI